MSEHLLKHCHEWFFFTLWLRQFSAWTLSLVGPASIPCLLFMHFYCCFYLEIFQHQFSFERLTQIFFFHIFSLLSTSIYINLPAFRFWSIRIFGVFLVFIKIRSIQNIRILCFSNSCDMSYRHFYFSSYVTKCERHTDEYSTQMMQQCEQCTPNPHTHQSAEMNWSSLAMAGESTKQWIIL